MTTVSGTQVLQSGPNFLSDQHQNKSIWSQRSCAICGEEIFCLVLWNPYFFVNTDPTSLTFLQDAFFNFLPSQKLGSLPRIAHMERLLIHPQASPSWGWAEGSCVGCCFQILVPSPFLRDTDLDPYKNTVIHPPPGLSSSYIQDLGTWLILYLRATSEFSLLSLDVYLKYPTLWSQFSILSSFLLVPLSPILAFNFVYPEGCSILTNLG